MRVLRAKPPHRALLAIQRLAKASLYGMVWVFLAFGTMPAAVAAKPSGLAYLGAGEDAWRMGDIVEASRRWTDAIRQCRLEGDTSTELQALARRGEAFAAMGQLRDGRADLELALSAAQQPMDKAALEGALGNLSFQAQKFDEAVTWLTRSIVLARSLGEPALDVLAASSNNRGNVAAVAGHLSEAMSYYHQAAAAARDANDSPLRATVAINLARVSHDLGEDNLAVGSLRDAAAIARELSSPRDQIIGSVAVGEAALKLFPPPVMRSQSAFLTGLLRQAQQTATAQADARGRSLSTGVLAELQYRLGQRREADESVHAAIWDAQRVDARDLLWRWEWLNGRIAQDDRDQPRALEAFDRAEATLEAIKVDLPIAYTDGVSSFRGDFGPLYFGLADQLLSEASGQTDKNKRDASIKRSINVIEAFKSGEIRNYFRDPCLDRLDSPSNETRSEIADVLPHEAVLYPVILPDRIEIVAKIGQKIGTKTQGELIHPPPTRVGQSDVEREIREFRHALEAGTGYEQSGRKLYDWFIQPLRNDLIDNQVTTLIVVPDGILRNIPFAALMDGSQFVLERFAVATEPSLRLTNLGAAKSGRERILLSGTTERTALPDGEFPELPGVDLELEAIHDLLPDATLIENADFSMSAMEHNLNVVPYTTVHIASHATFGSIPAESYFLTHAGQKFRLDQLQTAFKYNRLRDEPLDLLVLSACTTAAGNDTASLGLIGVAVSTGVRSAVGALWEVNDGVAAQMMPIFYRVWIKEGATKAEALRRAQLAALHDPDYHAPSFWAPLLLVGDWH